MGSFVFSQYIFLLHLFFVKSLHLKSFYHSHAESTAKMKALAFCIYSYVHQNSIDRLVPLRKSKYRCHIISLAPSVRIHRSAQSPMDFHRFDEILCSPNVVMCRSFSPMLRREARDWITTFAFRSIRNFDELSRSFVAYFLSSKKKLMTPLPRADVINLIIGGIAGGNSNSAWKIMLTLLEFTPFRRRWDSIRTSLLVRKI